jgi:hypothetical protein
MIKLLAALFTLSAIISCSSPKITAPLQTSITGITQKLPNPLPHKIYLRTNEELTAYNQQDPFAKLFDIYALDELHTPHMIILAAVEKLVRLSGDEWVIATGVYRGVQKTILHRTNCAKTQAQLVPIGLNERWILEKTALSFFKDNTSIFQIDEGLRIDEIVDMNDVVSNAYYMVTLEPILHGLPVFSNPYYESDFVVRLYMQPIAGQLAICSATFVKAELPKHFSVTPLLSRADVMHIAKKYYLDTQQKQRLLELTETKKTLIKSSDIDALSVIQQDIQNFTSHTAFKPSLLELGILGGDENHPTRLVYQVYSGIQGLGGSLRYFIDAVHGKVIMAENLLRSSVRVEMHCGNSVRVIKGRLK